MATLQQLVATIRTAIYGKDMREALAQAIEMIGADTGIKLDNTLSLEGYAAEALATGTRFQKLEAILDNLDSGLTRPEKDALLEYYAEQVKLHPELKAFYDKIYDIWNVPVAEIILDRYTANIAVGMSIMLQATVKPDNAYDKTITWSMNPEGICSMVGSKLFALKPGEVDVTATSRSKGRTATCHVVVTEKTYYTITKNLSLVTIDNQDDSVVENGSYAAKLSPSIEGYHFDQVEITMGGRDITSAAFSADTGDIYIQSVTGNIVITASAADTIFYNINYALTNMASTVSDKKVAENTPYSTTLTPTNAGYLIEQVQVMMGASDITETAAKISASKVEVTIEQVTADVTITATASEPKDLESCTWEQIQKIVSSGKAESYWKVGDTKNLVLNGKLGAGSDTTSFSQFAGQVFILGFDHNKALETGGKASVTFALGKKDNKLMALCGSNYGSYSSSNHFCMNPNGSNSGGWNGSYARKTMLEADPANKGKYITLILPPELVAAAGTVTKYTDNTGGGSNAASNVTATQDKFFLLSEYEVQGTRTYANSAEAAKQQQYSYFKAGNGKIAYKHSGMGTAVSWWLRSAFYCYSANFCYVRTGGSAYYNRSVHSCGLVPCFAVVAT